MRRWFLLVMISIAIWVLDGVSWLNWIKDPVGILVQPNKIKRYQKRVGEDSLKDVKGDAEKAILEAEVVALIEENKRLKELLGAPLDPGLKFIPANIISYKNGEMKVDVGTKGGASKDQVVMAYVKSSVNNGVVLGRVIESSAWQSRVAFIGSDKNSLKVTTESGVNGVVALEEDKLILKEVEQKSQLNLGELVISLGGDNWPPDLVVGRIAKINKEDTKVFQSAELEWVIDPYLLTQVWLLFF